MEKRLIDQDIETIMSYKNQFDYDLWTTEDMRLLKGSPLNLTQTPLYLIELGVKRTDETIKRCADILLSVQKDDGRFKVYPKGGIYPCQTAIALHSLCYMGYAQDERLTKSFDYFLDTQEEDGGWKCNKYSFGRGPETEYSTPMTTLTVLHAFIYKKGYEKINQLDRAVEFLLKHWEIKKPISPCHYGIGTLFMQVEYPIGDYNLFTYVYALSFYKKAREDNRFKEALKSLQYNVKDGQIVVERNSRKISKLNFCKKGEKSEYATRRYQEILHNLSK